MSKNDEFVQIIGIPFINKTKRTLLEDNLYQHLLKEEKTFVVTANPEIVMYAQKDKQYKETICKANYVVPDGIGIVIASKRQGTPLCERIAGYDLMIDLLKKADEQLLSCYLLGATNEVNKRAVQQIREKFPNVKVVGHHHGYFHNDDKIVEQIKKTAPDLIFVALGFPKQEFWIHNHFHQFEKGIFIGVGGSFDVLAGKVKRAPNFWIKLNLEWLYRLIKQPSRIFRMFDLFKFLMLILFKRTGKKER